MADTIKSALFVDYDSIYRRLTDADPEAADQFGQRVGAWVGAVESGALVTPGTDGARRRILIRRCYANPDTLGGGRAAFVSGGFEIVDCPLQEGRERNAADIHIVLDTLDALDHPTGYEEFILLSADADLTPVLLRLRAHNRSAVIYANEATAANYRAIADGTIEEARLIGLVTGEEEPEPVPAEPVREAKAPAPAAAPTDRSLIEALARKVHGATNVPLFSPRTYADLFRHIAQEIAERGYHFQHTAENVSEKLVAAGRNVNRRQVLFVVKGLALKGHVFSTTDTPERLAEVFREQVLYLIGNTDLKLEENELALLPSWIVGRVSAAQAAAEPPPEKPSAAAKLAKKPRPLKPAAPPARQPAANEPPPSEAAAKPPERAPAAKETLPSEPKEAAREAVPKPDDAAAAPRPAAAAAKPIPAPRKLDEIRAAAAARLAAIGRPAGTTKPTPRPAAAAKPAPAASRPVETAKPAKAKQGAAAPAGDANQDALESSILAAIAQAVDVLVEDSGGPSEREPEPAPPAPPPAAAEAPPEPLPSEGGDSDDIGDEIQRIIASYSRARQQGDSG